MIGSELFVMATGGDTVVVFDLAGAQVTQPCGEIPWLHQDPISDTVASMSTNIVDITFDATAPVITQTGQYFGNMLVANDAHGDLVIPVTMTVVIGAFDVNLSPDDAMSSDPGTTVTYTVTVENLGNVLDTYDLALGPSNWPTTLSDSTVMLADGESTTVVITVDIPAGAAGGEMDMVTVTATSQSDGSATDSTNLTTTANVIYGVSVASDMAASGDIGGSVTYQIWITNTGNTTDTFDISFSGNSWTTTASPTSVSLASGEGTMVMVTVDIPSGASSGEMDVATATATSQGDGTVSGSVMLTTTAEGTFIYLPFVAKNN